jgi:hypothetical protein
MSMRGPHRRERGALRPLALRVALPPGRGISKGLLKIQKGFQYILPQKFNRVSIGSLKLTGGGPTATAAPAASTGGAAPAARPTTAGLHWGFQWLLKMQSGGLKRLLTTQKGKRERHLLGAVRHGGGRRLVARAMLHLPQENPKQRVKGFVGCATVGCACFPAFVALVRGRWLKGDRAVNGISPIHMISISAFYFTHLPVVAQPAALVEEAPALHRTHVRLCRCRFPLPGLIPKQLGLGLMFPPNTQPAAAKSHLRAQQQLVRTLLLQLEARGEAQHPASHHPHVRRHRERLSRQRLLSRRYPAHVKRDMWREKPALGVRGATRVGYFCREQESVTTPTGRERMGSPTLPTLQ